MKVLIWGTGESAKKYLQRNELQEREIIGFVESNPSSVVVKSICFEGVHKIYKPIDIKKLEYDFVLVCVWIDKFVCEIADKCLELGILDERIIFMRNIRGITLQADGFIYYNKYQNDNKIKKIFPIFFNEFLEYRENYFNKYVLSARNNEDIQKNSLLQTSSFKDYTKDYFRYRTFEFVATEIKDRNIGGSVAELGVALGTFSRIINKVFDEKILYMFDTFDSFDKQEFDDDNSLATKSEEFYNLYRNINIENVMNSMPYKNKCVIRKGLFPDTAAGMEDETYAFVSIDVDLEKSIYSGLEYFYPRLNEGGLIFVHDYRCYDLEGVKRAVLRYEEEHGRLYKVPIADRGGTLIIIK